MLGGLKGTEHVTVSSGVWILPVSFRRGYEKMLREVFRVLGFDLPLNVLRD